VYTLRVKSHFDAAHYIKDYVGKCSREHGHRWVVEVAVAGKELNGMNMLIDFGAVKAPLERLLERLDHYQLNRELQEENLTAEFLVKWIYDRFWPQVDGTGLELESVTVWESPDCSVEYRT